MGEGGWQGKWDYTYHIGWLQGTSNVLYIIPLLLCSWNKFRNDLSLFFFPESLRQELTEQRVACSELQKGLKVLQNEQRALGPLGKWQAINQCPRNGTDHAFITEVSSLAPVHTIYLLRPH